MKQLVHRLRLLGISTLLAGQLVLSAQATAANSPHEEARRHFYVGVKLLKVEDFKGALTEFETSLRIRSSKATLFNLANTYKALHRYHEALRTIELLRDEFGHELDRELTGHVDQIEADLLEIVAQVTVNVVAEGAKIYYRQRLIGEAPLEGPLFVGPGNHQILVSAEGYHPHELSFSVVSQEEKILDIELDALHSRAQSPQLATQLSGTVASRGWRPAAFWTSAGITGACALGFVVTDLVVLGRNRKISEGGQSDDYVRATENLQAFDRTLGIASLAGLAATGIIAIFTDFQRSKEPPEDGFSLTGAVSFEGGPGFVLQGVF